MKSVQAHIISYVGHMTKVAEPCTSMTECRVNMWRSKTRKSGASSDKFCSLTSTNAAFVETINRSHLLVATWKAALLESPQTMDRSSHGWELVQKGILLPRTVSIGTLSSVSVRVIIYVWVRDKVRLVPLT